MVHVGEMGPPLGVGLPKSPSFHQGLAFATVLRKYDTNKPCPSNSALQYQPLQPLLIGNSGVHFDNCFYFLFRWRNIPKSLKKTASSM